MAPPSNLSTRYWAAGEQHIEEGVESGLPAFHEATNTKRICIAGLIISYPLSIACLVMGVYIICLQNAFIGSGFHGKPLPYDLNLYDGNQADPGQYDGSQADPFFWVKLLLKEPTIYFLPYVPTLEVYRVIIVIVVALVTECLGYVHSVSLRWCLWYEGRLQYNSNIRLFCSAGSFLVNSWYTNILSATTLVLSYAAGSSCLTPLTYPILQDSFEIEPTAAFVSGVSLLVLGASILTQAVLAHICIAAGRTRLESWSSDPLNTALIALRFSELSGRSVDQSTISPANEVLGNSNAPKRGRETGGRTLKPDFRQPSMIVTDRYLRWTLRLVWTLSSFTLGWAGLVAMLHDVPDSLPMVTLNRSSNANMDPVDELGALFVLAAFQIPATITIHCAEVVVNRCRDEQQWRKLHSVNGCVTAWNSVFNAFTSWQTIILFFFKLLVHYLYGSSVVFSTPETSIVFEWPFLFPLFGSILMLAIFTTLMVGNRPKGPQPSTYGHLPTLRHLIDDWGAGTDQRQRLYWGDKGAYTCDGLETRHAGTSGNKSDIGEIDMDALYGAPAATLEQEYSVSRLARC